jgi:hypothetical protein
MMEAQNIHVLQSTKLLPPHIREQIQSVAPHIKPRAHHVSLAHGCPGRSHGQHNTVLMFSTHSGRESETFCFIGTESTQGLGCHELHR